MKKIFWIVLITILIYGCYYDSEERLYPKLDQTCDTTGVTFSKSILPVLQTNCFGCHGTTEYSASGGNVNLGDFAQLKQFIEQGNFYGAITHNPLYSPMPKGGVKIDTCSVTKIKIWIDKGALDN
jgi:hypothetical protein